MKKLAIAFFAILMVVTLISVSACGPKGGKETKETVAEETPTETVETEGDTADVGGETGETESAGDETVVDSGATYQPSPEIGG